MKNKNKEGRKMKLIRVKCKDGIKPFSQVVIGEYGSIASGGKFIIRDKGTAKQLINKDLDRMRILTKAVAKGLVDANTPCVAVISKGTPTCYVYGPEGVVVNE